MFNDFISLLFPNLCSSCGKPLYKGEKHICTYCIYHLPKTNFHIESDNSIYRMFWGRVNIENACSYYYFNKGNKVQNLIHQLKYKSKKEIGIKIGELYGNELIKADAYKNIDFIVPVPLHKSKEKKRGYNQSYMFAEGLSNSMKIQIENNIIIRNKASQTQTKKSRIERWDNVSDIFSVKDFKKLEGKHILIVDDVITTGATIEACAIELSKIPNIKISVASIACTVDN